MLALVLVIREASTEVAPGATTFTTLAPAEEDGKAKPLSNNEENDGKREANTAYSEFDQHDYDYRQFVFLAIRA